MSNRKPDQPYFDWLTTQVAIGKPGKTYYELFNRLHDTAFVSEIKGDSNRAQDGKDLRTYYFKGRTRFNDYVSVLEVIVGLSRRLAFIAGGEPEQWAWILIENLELDRFSDPFRNPNVYKSIDEILHVLIWRTYEPDGRGGFFPLNYPKEDQRTVEIWHQLQAYVNEIVRPT